jgi:hypothetical protein
VGGVDAVDVERGVGLGVAESLRLGERGVERVARLQALDQVRAGAVEERVERDRPRAAQRVRRAALRPACRP